MQVQDGFGRIIRIGNTSSNSRTQKLIVFYEYASGNK